MKLYFSPGACSLSPHIVLREAGLPFDLVKVNISTHKLEGGEDYYAINDKGYVPDLELDDGSRLTEGAAIVQYLADRVPQRKLAPENGTMPRYRLQEWLNFITSELHKQYSWIFNKAMHADVQASQREKLHGRYKWIDGKLGPGPYLMGADFTVADAYLFTVMRWNHHTKVDTSDLPTLTAWYERVKARPAVQAALEAEGIRG